MVARGSRTILCLPGIGLVMAYRGGPLPLLPSPFEPVLNTEIPGGGRSPWRNLVPEPWGWADGKSELSLFPWSPAGGEASRHPAEQLWFLHQRLPGGESEPPETRPPDTEEKPPLVRGSGKFAGGGRGARRVSGAHHTLPEFWIHIQLCSPS